MRTLPAIILGIAIGVGFASWLWQENARKKALKHGCGYYDSHTGEFKWKQAGDMK